VYSNKIKNDGKIFYEIEKGEYKDYKIYTIDELRFYYMTGKVNKSFTLTYEVPTNNTLTKKIFNSNLPYKITNTVYDYYFNKGKNATYEVLNILKENISKLEDYSFIEYNIGVGNYTILFASLSKHIIVCLDENILNMELTQYNIGLSRNVNMKSKFDDELESVYIGSKLFIFINKYNKINHFLNYKLRGGILFVNYIAANKHEPDLYDLKDLKTDYIVILTENIINNISEYFPKFKYYRLNNSYVYIIHKNKSMFLFRGQNVIINKKNFENVRATILETGNMEPYPVKFYQNGIGYTMNIFENEIKELIIEEQNLQDFEERKKERERKKREEKEKERKEREEKDPNIIKYCKDCKKLLDTLKIDNKKSFYLWARENHPDKFNLKEEKLNAEEIFKKVSPCYIDWSDNDSICKYREKIYSFSDSEEAIRQDEFRKQEELRRQEEYRRQEEAIRERKEREEKKGEEREDFKHKDIYDVLNEINMS
jgi:hypothetical protein